MVRREQLERMGDLPAHRERLRAGVVQPHAARAVLSALRALDAHLFFTDDVSLSDSDVPTITGHRQVTDAHLLTLARRRVVGVLHPGNAVFRCGNLRRGPLLGSGRRVFAPEELA